MDSTVLSLINDIFTGAYVILTLVLVVMTIWSVKITRASLDLTREQMDINKQQSKDSAEASEKQSKAALNAIYEQIASSEKQAREAVYNQHKPVIVPINKPVSHDTNMYMLTVKNKGLGVALNTWGLITIKDFPLVNYLIQTYFLIPDAEAQIHFMNGDVQYPLNVFENYTIFPQADNSGISATVRLMVTYNDAFNNKYLVIFDFSDEFGWRQIDLKKVEKRLDELASKKKH